MKTKTVRQPPFSDKSGMRGYMLRILILVTAGLIAGYLFSDRIIDLFHRALLPAEPTPRYHKLSSDAWLA